MSMISTDLPAEAESRSGPQDPQEQGVNPRPGKRQTKPLTASLIRERWEKASRSIQKERRDYWLNLAFLLDEQWIWWDTKRRAVSEMPRDPNRVRVVINRIRPNLQTLIAKLMQRELAFEVQPTATDDATTQGAKLGEEVLEGNRIDQSWERLRHEQLMATFLGGTSGIAVEWDSEAGTELDIDPETNNVLGTGEVSLTVCNVCEMAFPPGIRDYLDADYWVRGIAMPPEEARRKYNLSFTPKADATGQYSPFQQRLLADSGRPMLAELCMVLSYYERPNMERPQGAVATVIGDQFVDGPYGWPFPFDDHLNIAVFRQLVVPGRWTGDTLATSVRPVQVAYNHIRSSLLEHAKLAGNARLMVPDAALDIIDALTDEPGEIVPFNGQAGQPYYLAPPNLPRWMMQEADRLSAEIDDIMHVHPVSRGEAGQDSSGVALSVLAEKDDTPMGLMAFDQSHGWAKVGTMVLQLYADKATEPRMTVVPGKQVPRQVQWSGARLQGQTRVRVPIDNVMPHSRVAQQAYATQLWDRKIITDPEQYARMVDLPDQENLALDLDPDAAKAQWENEMLAQDMPMMPADFDDHGIHITEHNRHRKSQAYFFAAPQIQQLFDMHVQAHENLEAEQLAQQQARAMAGGPELAQMPQADEPPGSQVPATLVQRNAMAKGGGPAPAGNPISAPGAPGAPSGPTPPGPMQGNQFNDVSRVRNDVNPAPGERR